jgi:hypothetical protein
MTGAARRASVSRAGHGDESGKSFASKKPMSLAGRCAHSLTSWDNILKNSSIELMPFGSAAVKRTPSAF